MKSIFTTKCFVLHNEKRRNAMVDTVDRDRNKLMPPPQRKFFQPVNGKSPFKKEPLKINPHKVGTQADKIHKQIVLDENDTGFCKGCNEPRCGCVDATLADPFRGVNLIERDPDILETNQFIRSGD